eukprot:CAMPEP_0184686482 /NCGR_PEP_ID=MMETSP0312-20130426/22667_1 /TAXON_ID=31354 /ORGANISM="Compsopogon coeruleus, Strain SAG 36.94" /LENGTH=378 /DNA_ID=CAMNT_0027141623 /DNA_START=44 /DNA_END=1178 /DNA_ORIENTATION=+
MVVEAAKEELARHCNSSSEADVDTESLRLLESSLDRVAELSKTLLKKLDEVHKLQDTFENAVHSLNRNITSLNKSHREGERKAASKANESLAEYHYLIPTAGGRFARLFLGTHNVRFQRRKDRMMFKEQYESFKQSCVPLFIALCILCLVFQRTRWLHMLLQLLLAYYYVTLALQENILEKNGSNIKRWWIIHHYLSIVEAVVLVTWPNSDSYAQFCRPLHWYGLLNSVIQFFQTRYQKARLYARRALGKAGEMDVSNADSSAVIVHWHEGMKILIPLVLVGQAFQLYVSIVLFRIYNAHRTEPHILLCGLLFLIMFFGNLSTTVYTLQEKAKEKEECGPDESRVGFAPMLRKRSPFRQFCNIDTQQQPLHTSIWVMW